MNARISNRRLSIVHVVVGLDVRADRNFLSAPSDNLAITHYSTYTVSILVESGDGVVSSEELSKMDLYTASVRASMPRTTSFVYVRWYSR